MSIWENSFKDKAVLISGGLGDIALAVAHEFGKHGAKIAIADVRSPEAALSKLTMLDDQNIDYHYQQVNVGDGSAVERWIQDIETRWGHIDVAIVNAATVTLKNLEQITTEEWQNEIQVNLNGSFFMANSACKSFVKLGIKGNVVFLGSWAAHAVHENIPAYSVSKAAVRMLCQTMALTYAGKGIRVNEIAPGYVNAGLSKEVWRQDPQLAAEAQNHVPVQALIESEEVAKQICWMCLPENRHLTGSTILMDGGLSLMRKK